MEIDDIITLILALFVAGGLAYFKKKGENQATKQDIEGITRQIKRVENEYLKEITEFQAGLDTKLFEHQTRFSAFYQEQTEVIAELYKMLYDAEVAVRQYVLDGAVDDPKSAVIALEKYYGRHKIYLRNPQLCETVENIAKEMWDAIKERESADVSKSFSDFAEGGDTRAMLREAWSTIDTEVGVLKRELEQYIEDIWRLQG